MKVISRSPTDAVIVTTRSSAEVYLSAEELAAAAGLTPLQLARLVRAGLLEPDENGFTAETAARLRRMLRLRADLGVNLVGAAIIVDLLARLEHELREKA